MKEGGFGFNRVVELMEQIEAKRGVIERLELGKECEGRGSCESTERLSSRVVSLRFRKGLSGCASFVEEHRGVMESIFLGEAEVEKIQGGVAELTLFLVLKFEQDMIVWLKSARRVES